MNKSGVDSEVCDLFPCKRDQVLEDFNNYCNHQLYLYTKKTLKTTLYPDLDPSFSGDLLLGVFKCDWRVLLLACNNDNDNDKVKIFHCY